MACCTDVCTCTTIVNMPSAKKDRRGEENPLPHSLDIPVQRDRAGGRKEACREGWRVHVLILGRPLLSERIMLKCDLFFTLSHFLSSSLSVFSPCLTAPS